MSIFKKAQTKTPARGVIREISAIEAQAVSGGTANTAPGCGTRPSGGRLVLQQNRQ